MKRTDRSRLLALCDADLVRSAIRCRGITRRPLSPVHPRCRMQVDGGMVLSWTRRARGSWAWPDLIDTPLNEQQEAYRVTLGAAQMPMAMWETGIASLMLDHATLSDLRARFFGQPLQVQQQGAGGLSPPLLLTTLN